MITEKKILTFVSAYYLLLQIPTFSNTHKKLCKSIGIDWKLNLSFTQYMNFLMPFLAIIVIIKKNEPKKGNSIHLYDIWSLAHFTSGILGQAFWNDSDKALIAHLIFEIYENCGSIKIIRNILPKNLKKIFQLNDYNGDTIENVTGDFFFFYLGVLVYNKFLQMKKNEIKKNNFT